MRGTTWSTQFDNAPPELCCQDSWASSNPAFANENIVLSDQIDNEYASQTALPDQLTSNASFILLLVANISCPC